MKERIKKFLRGYKLWLLLLTGVGLFIDIFLFDPTSDLVILLLVGLWALSVWLYGFEGRVSVALALGFLVLCPFLLIFGKDAIAEKSAIWSYMFLLVGVVRQVLEQ